MCDSVLSDDVEDICFALRERRRRLTTQVEWIRRRRRRWDEAARCRRCLASLADALVTFESLTFGLVYILAVRYLTAIHRKATAIMVPLKGFRSAARQID